MSCSYQYETAPVVENRETLPGYRRIAAAARPGQFVMLRGWEDQRDPILPRPFDIAAADPAAGTVMVIVKTAGRGTRLLADYAPGTSLLTAGPLGKAIPEPYPDPLGLLVRGVGSAAVTFLARRAAAAGGRVIAVLSASTSSRLVGKEELEESGAELHTATDDGSEGFHGNGTELLDSIMRGTALSAVYTCGSKRFARHVRSLDEAGRCAGFIFLEGYMACGRGECHGCAVRRRDDSGYALVCRDGPVFHVSEVEIE